jgi:hypothetical protein
MEKECDKHGLTDHYKEKNRKDSWRCRKCIVDSVQVRRTKIKQMGIDYKGGKCQIETCGYNKYNGALEFHHLDPNEKDFSISRSGHCTAWDKVKLELDKCILVCANCHREIHAGLITI